MEESLAALVADGVDARAWLALGRRVSESPVPDRLRGRGVPVAVRHADTAMAPASIASLVSSLRSLGPGGILHSHGERALLWGRAAARIARVRHVHTNHGFVENTGGDERRVRWARRLLRGVDATVAVHPAVADGLPGARVVPNCLDAETFAAQAGDRQATRRRLGLGRAERCVLFCGRLEPEKGADLIALIQAGLQASSAAARLYVAGSGSLAPGVEAMADVRLLGHRDDPAALVGAADVVVLPSRREGLPMVALEAAAVGTPVVGFAVGGLADSGLATPVPVEDVDALVSASLALVRDARVRVSALQRSAAALAERFAPGPHVTALRRLYGELSR